MRKSVLDVLLAFACLVSVCAAYAEENTAFDIVKQHLLADQAEPSVLSSDEISAMIEDLSQNGYSVPEGECREEGYSCDVARNILQAVFGSYYNWSIEEKHMFDQIMVECGELPYCHNLMPSDGEISQEAAQNLALTEIAKRFNLDQPLVEQPSAVYVAYSVTDQSIHGGKWRFGIDLSNQMSFDVDVIDGAATRCEKVRAMDELETEYNLLCDQRGAFFKWSLQDKMEFADSLPQKLEKARENDTLLMSDVELEAIAAYGFCLPTDEVLSQKEAYAAAAAAMEEKFGISGENCEEVYYSFFFQKDIGYVWRVIFWITGDAERTSVIVDMQALTGDVLSIKSNGNALSEYIPYVERL